GQRTQARLDEVQEERDQAKVPLEAVLEELDRAYEALERELQARDRELQARDRELQAQRRNEALRDRLERFEAHPVLGPALRGRRRLRRMLHALGASSAQGYGVG